MKHIQLENGMWLVERPGYFGSRKAEKIAKLNEDYGEGKWKLVWYDEGKHSSPPINGPFWLEFANACSIFYEESYFMFLEKNPHLVDLICSYEECFDNDTTNVQSGLDYTIQEAKATHIQDIAVRNCLQRLGRKFEGPKGSLYQIRSHSSNGWMLGPGHVPYGWPQTIIQPSLCPKWGVKGSVEDFWQSNKYVGIYK